MSEKAKAKFERLVSEDLDRRCSEADALIWKISISGITGDLEGTYDPQPAMDWLEEIFKSNYQPSPDEVSGYVAQHNVHERAARAALREAWAKEKAAQARLILHTIITKTLRDELYLLVSDEVPRRILSESASLRYLEKLDRWAMQRRTVLLKEREGIVEHRGRKADWTKGELSKAIEKLTTDFVKEHYRSPVLRDLADALTSQHPDKTPLSGDALRLKLKRLKINWKEIKTGITSRIKRT